MIFIRYKNAPPLHTVINQGREITYFGNLLNISKTIDIIYFDSKIKNVSVRSAQCARLIGELERRNLDFILLLNKNCEIHHTEKSSDLTIINVDSIPENKLQGYLNAGSEPFTKAQMFDSIFREYFEHNTEESFKTNFWQMLQGLAQDEVDTKQILFIAMSGQTGAIHHSTKNGIFLHEDKIWFSDEKYDFMAESEPTVVKRTVDNVEEFAKKYLTKCCITSHSVKKYTKDELKEIISTYPKLFSDLILKNHSYYDRDYQEYIMNNYDDFLEEDDLDEEIEEYYDAKNDIPADMELCYQCQNLVDEKDTDEWEITAGKMVKICRMCITGHREY